MTIRARADWPDPRRPAPPLTRGPGADPYDWLRGELFAQRKVTVTGELDDAAAGDAVAQLMTLDATGDDPVELQLNAHGVDLDAAFAVMDTIDLLGVEVHATCVGRAEGTAVGVLAVATRRRMSVNARVRLSEPDAATSDAASRLRNWAEQLAAQLGRFHERLAQATGQPVERIASDLRRGVWLTAPETVAYGLADEVATPDARIYPWRRRGGLGFRPPEG